MNDIPSENDAKNISVKVNQYNFSDTSNALNINHSENE